MHAKGLSLFSSCFTGGNGRIYGRTRIFDSTGFCGCQNEEVEGACNIATGSKTSLLDLIRVLSEITGKTSEISFDAPREGDIVHSQAITRKLNNELGLTAKTGLKQGLVMLIASVQ